MEVFLNENKGYWYSNREIDHWNRTMFIINLFIHTNFDYNKGGILNL